MINQAIIQKEEYKESKLQIIPYIENFQTKISAFIANNNPIESRQNSLDNTTQNLKEKIISNSLNILRKTQQQWQTSNNRISIGNHPPLEEIKLTHLQLPIIASPFEIGVSENECQNNMNLKQIKYIQQ